MTYVRSYVMKANSDAADELRTVLAELQAVVRTLPGSLRVDLLRDLDQPEAFHFIELWESKDAHTGAGKLLPKALMDRLKPCLAAAPTSHNLEPIA